MGIEIKTVSFVIHLLGFMVKIEKFAAVCLVTQINKYKKANVTNTSTLYWLLFLLKLVSS